jgi:hypothetical protein
MFGLPRYNGPGHRIAWHSDVTDDGGWHGHGSAWLCEVQPLFRNGRGHRIAWHSDATDDGTTGLPDRVVDGDDPWYRMVYADVLEMPICGVHGCGCCIMRPCVDLVERGRF